MKEGNKLLLFALFSFVLFSLSLTFAFFFFKKKSNKIPVHIEIWSSTHFFLNGRPMRNYFETKGKKNYYLYLPNQPHWFSFQFASGTSFEKKIENLPLKKLFKVQQTQKEKILFGSHILKRP